MTLDLSTLTLTPEPFKFLISNPSSTATLVPSSTFQGNNATLTMTGEVEWNSTTSSNTIWLTINTNYQMGGSDYVKVSYGNTTVLTQNFSSLGTISITFLTTFTAAAIADGTLEFGIYDSNDEPYCVQYMDISALTLAPDPTPRMNVTSADQAVTITPATFNTAKTATGEAPYNTSSAYNYLPLSLAYTGTWNDNYYKIIMFDSNGISRWETPTYMGSSNLPSVIGVEITDAYIGSGQYIDISIFGAETPTSFDTATNTIRIDTSALTLEAAPVSQFGVEITGFTYNNITYSLTDILNNSSTATLTATWADNEATTNITGLDIKYNDIKGDGSFVNPIGITLKNGMYNEKELIRCLSAQGGSGIIDGSGYYFPHTYIVDIKNLMGNKDQFSFTCMDADNNAVYLYLNVNNSTLTPQP